MKPHTTPPAANTVRFPPCHCGRRSIVAIGAGGWCLTHIDEALRALELLRDIRS